MARAKHMAIVNNLNFNKTGTNLQICSRFSYEKVYGYFFNLPNLMNVYRIEKNL